MTEMSAEDSSVKVTFTVKELLTQINGKLDTMALAIAAKAEAVEVQRLAAKVEGMESKNQANEALGKLYLAEWETMKSDVKHLKDAQISAKTIAAYKRWLVATGITLVATVITLVYTLHQLFH